ncbi:Rossmann-fold NAD(P)-binding domain-containing protein [Acidicapsa ligni]|uniref:NAD-dependent dehydratase n=1 Tax=Acidicapsa ligni TaxID=542300 RepID=UPI0021DFEE31|nr:NAD-dependent dehydratase [Acidicapsa ligni]
MKLLLLGASGLVGKNVLAQALAHPDVIGVVAPTRRPLAPHPKLRNPVSDHLDSLLSAEITQGIDGVVCTLGTTIGKAGSKEAFREVDYVLPLTFARSAYEHGVGTFVLVSASVANVGSAIFYPRIKGEVERDLELVGFRSLTIVRPSLIGGERDESRFGESVALRLMSIFAPILPKKLQINPAPTIAAACLSAAMGAKPGVHFRLAENLVRD